MHSTNLKLPISLFLVIGIAVAFCLGQTDVSKGDNMNPSQFGELQGKHDTKGPGEALTSVLRVKRGGGGYGYGYGGGQWTGYCCNYGYGISPGCQYNGFWNARNNPYCY